jgi:hypothetical protein
VVLCDGLTEGNLCVVALVISGAALQLDGNQTESFRLKGGLVKGGCTKGGCTKEGCTKEGCTKEGWTKPPPEPTDSRGWGCEML